MDAVQRVKTLRSQGMALVEALAMYLSAKEMVFSAASRAMEKDTAGVGARAELGVKVRLALETKVVTAIYNAGRLNVAIYVRSLPKERAAAWVKRRVGMVQRLALGSVSKMLADRHLSKLYDVQMNCS